MLIAESVKEPVHQNLLGQVVGYIFLFFVFHIKLLRPNQLVLCINESILAAVTAVIFVVTLQQ